MKLRMTNFIPLMITMPSILIGVVAMYYNKVPFFIWAQNIVCLVMAEMISYFVVSSKFDIIGNKFYYNSILISVIFLMLTFFGADIEGVNRWVSIGIIKLNFKSNIRSLVLIICCKSILF
ncbi:hypothetical protein [Clostridium saccharoperbutylacetonicum]|uniref:hypothetical protein n=1 Tax=Clostridium saccharoperbutylacetonicum TaxID=36745 RepID=UPI0039EC33AD